MARSSVGVGTDNHLRALPAGREAGRRGHRGGSVASTRWAAAASLASSMCMRNRAIDARSRILFRGKPLEAVLGGHLDVDAQAIGIAAGLVDQCRGWRPGWS
ncbi:MAG: hypothetical protein QM749_20210 [Aquabacterium sp.]